MPWQSQGGGGGGPWGSGGGNQGPWGRGPSGGHQGGPPDIEEMLRRGQDRMRQMVPGGMGSWRVIALIIVGAVVVWALTGLYQVRPDQVGVPIVFGKPQGLTTPGLHWNWPMPIGYVERPSVTTVNTEEIGVVGERAQELLMLTGDENIIDVRFAVQWQIGDPVKYLFNIHDPEQTIRNSAESAMREIVGQTPFEFVRSGQGRAEITARTSELLQRMLDEYGAGVVVTELALRNTDPPADVNQAFQDVAAAIQDAQRSRNEAERDANQVTNRAKGEAEQIIRQAEAYRDQKIAIATGEAQRFLSVYEQYRRAPDVTQRRMYLETMERIMRGLDKVLIDETSGAGSVPYLSLNELMRRSQASQGKPEDKPAAGASQ
jgi:membrane protease subunit HflK